MSRISVTVDPSTTAVQIENLDGKFSTYRFVVYARTASGDSSVAYSNQVLSVKAEADRLMTINLPDFLAVYGGERPSPYAWDNYDGCSFPSLNPRFEDMCLRHDFGYRNYGLGGELELGSNETTRRMIDARLRDDIVEHECGQFSANPATVACYAIALDVYVGLRIGGEIAFY